MGTRLYVNLSQVYAPLYLQDSLKLERDSIAIIPLIIYLSGFGSSFFMKLLNRKLGNKITYLLGALSAVGASVWLYFGYGDTFRYIEVYAVAVLIGIGGSTMLITSLSLTSDLIGNNTSSGAFVFGAMSFLDKISNGLAIVIIQDIHPCVWCCKDCQWYYQYVLVFSCGGSAIFTLFLLATLACSPIGVKTRSGIARSNRAVEEINYKNNDGASHLGIHDNEDNDTTNLIETMSSVN
ncbi:major facilitator superfamily domain-containing protein 12-like [Limulus polyphemus]|uniref:Major facilitator superfamily domain-containing protein 12-like n=1 Tax=Limulus polyphemus TaxID=6850 RepID=A0ABM1BU65_LIMPO|nr:major facilitator superfamily domain-containing protein 12-like [Limulus polyphemus]